MEHRAHLASCENCQGKAKRYLEQVEEVSQELAAALEAIEKKHGTKLALFGATDRIGILLGSSGSLPPKEVARHLGECIWMSAGLEARRRRKMKESKHE